MRTEHDAGVVCCRYERIEAAVGEQTVKCSGCKRKGVNVKLRCQDKFKTRVAAAGCVNAPKPKMTRNHTWVVVARWSVEVPRQQLPLHTTSSEVGAVQAVRIKAEAAASKVVACMFGAKVES